MVQKSRKSLRKFPHNLIKGSLLEAKDVYNTWYPVKVISLNEDRVRVHFCNWSSRYDTWYSLTSSCLRPLMLTTSRNGRDSRGPPCAPRPNRKSEEASQYESGTYVMALWRNDYEYLARVLAHRQRQGDRSEYRLRYIWDNAVEWTPVSRIRKASQYEIHFVLQFCKQQASGSGISTSRTKSSTPVSQMSYGLTTRSHLKHAHQIQSPSIDPKSTQNSVKLKKTGLESRSETSLEQDGMVYDKAVLQFHEACRKRRELKRQAAAEADNVESLSPSINSSSVTDCQFTACFKLSSDTGESISDRKRKAYSECFAHKSKMRRSLEHCTTSPCNEVKLDDPSSVTGNQPSQPVASVKDRLIDVKSSSKSPLASSPMSVDTQESGSGACSVDNAKNYTSDRLILTISKQKCQLSHKRSPVHVMTSPSHRKDDTDNNTNTDSISSDRSITKPIEPIIYPCPYCPRRLRHAKLLTAHISNYHKTEETVEVSRTKKCHYDGNSVKRKVESPPSLDNRCISSKDKITRYLLACHRCNTRSCVSSDETENLLQCKCCLSWVHQTCYPAPFVLCDGCLLTNQRSRPSRRNECHLSWWQSSPNDCHSSVGSFNHHLLSDTCELLDWTHRLTPLVKTGWALMDNTNPSSPLSTTPLVSNRASKRTQKRSSHSTTLGGLPDFTDIGSPVKDGIDAHVSSAPVNASDNDIQLRSENVGNLYMELEHFTPMDRMIPITTQIGSSAMDRVATAVTNTSVPLSAVTSSTDSSYWRVTEDGDDNDEVLVADSDDALTGFLQDLGPNVLPDLDDMDYLTPCSADSTGQRSAVVLNGQDDDILSTIQTHETSILDTPVKEALSVANLLNPVPVSMMSSVLQSAGNSLCPLAVENQVDQPIIMDTQDTYRDGTLFTGNTALSNLEDKTERSTVEDSTTVISASVSKLLTGTPPQDVTSPHSTTGVLCTAPQVVLPLSTSSSSFNNSMDSLSVSELDWLRTRPTLVVSEPIPASAVPFDPKSSETHATLVDGVGTTQPSSGCLVDHNQLVLLSTGECNTTNRLEGDENDYLDHRWEILANSRSNRDLTHLDEFILGPLERAITAMEAQLECISSKLFVSDASNI